ncbi:replication protein, partial [uncultured marine virus]
MAQSKHWCFTINNWNAEDDERLQELGNNCEYLVYGYETGAQGTPHLQGYVVFRTKVRMGIARGLLGGRAHVEIKRGTPLQAATYCKKEGLFFETGELPGPQGVRNDMVHARDWIIRHQEEHGDVPTELELIMEIPGLYGRYRSNLLSMCHALRKKPEFDTGEMRPWQAELNEILKLEPDDRKILFYVDAIGGAGKSWYQRYKLTTCNDVQLLSSGKRDDIAHAVDEQKRIFFFNVPRGGMQFLPYT